MHEQLDRREAEARDFSYKNVGKWRMHKLQEEANKTIQIEGVPSCQGTQARKYMMWKAKKYDCQIVKAHKKYQTIISSSACRDTS